MRRGNGEGSIFFDPDRSRWVGKLPRDEYGRREKVIGATRRDVQSRLRTRIQERELRGQENELVDRVSDYAVLVNCHSIYGDEAYTCLVGMSRSVLIRSQCWLATDANGTIATR